MKVFAVFALLFAVAASAQLGSQAPSHPALSKFISKDAVTIDADGSSSSSSSDGVSVVGTAVPTARLTPAQIADAKAFYVTKMMGSSANTVGIFRALGACGPNMRLAGLESYTQAKNVVDNLKDAVSVDRNFWIANTRAGGSSNTDYYLMTKGTSVSMTAVTTATSQPSIAWNAPTAGVGTNDCIQVQFRAATSSSTASASLVPIDCVATGSAAYVLCEMDWTSTNPMLDRVI